ncbi:MAG: sulfatase-like hydrolase/transferase [Hyphomicrobiaceae bacterium]
MGPPVARATSAIGLALLALIWLTEGWFTNIVFTWGVTAAIAAFVLILSRRPLFSVTCTAVLVVLINGTSWAKQQTLGMMLHAYDLFFYVTSWATVSYLWQGARLHVLLFASALIVSTVAAWAAWRAEPAHVSRRRAVVGFVVAVLVAIGAAATNSERPQMRFYWKSHFVSAFYSSWVETMQALLQGQLIQAAQSAGLPPLAAMGRCEPSPKPPHIVLIHQESIVQPSLFKGLTYDRGVDPFFRSHDGELHRMRVETYGGASWLSEFSILAGLSTHAFGGMRDFVQAFLAGKVHDTVPEVLARCGYRNVVFYPMQRNFVSNSRFYNAIGLKEVFDQKAQGAPSTIERDAFYYGNALKEIGRHVSRSEQPMFVYIQTMSAHWPYTFKYAPEMDVPGGGPDATPEMHEYLRRLTLATRDYDAFVADLEKRFPGERFLVMHYGDHQPLATRSLIGKATYDNPEDMALGPLSLGYITYFAVNGINVTPPPLPKVRTLDVPYLGTVLLQQAGLPLPPSYRARMALLEQCEGRYQTCPRQNNILAFHRRLIDAGLLISR